MSHPVYRWKCIMSLQPCISTSDVRMLSWSRICSFISSCICRNIFANIPALRNWWQVFYRLVKFFQRNAKIWETGKNRRGNLWYSFQGTCCSWEGVQSLVKWPPKPSVTLNGLQALRNHFRASRYISKLASVTLSARPYLKLRLLFLFFV